MLENYRRGKRETTLLSLLVTGTCECEDLALAVLAFGVVEPKHQKWLEDV